MFFDKLPLIYFILTTSDIAVKIEKLIFKSYQKGALLSNYAENYAF